MGSMSALRSLFVSAAAMTSGAALYRLSRHSGASAEEVHGGLPGDELIAHPMVEWTRAGTIEATPSVIWPWLVQMGYGRGGWYTNERIDRLLWRVSASNASAVLPDYQTLKVGDIVADGPEHAAYFHVREVQPERAIVYRSLRHPYRGHPLPDTEPSTLLALEAQLREQGSWLDFSWAFVLRPLDPSRTRLIIRTRADYAPPAIGWLEVPLGLVDLFHAHTIIAGIRARAEAVPA